MLVKTKDNTFVAFKIGRCRSKVKIQSQLIKHDILDAIVILSLEKPYPPTIREIAALVEHSNSVVHRYVLELVRDGSLQYSKMISRSIRIVSN